MSSGLCDSVAAVGFGPCRHFVCHQNTVSMCLSCNEAERNAERRASPEATESQAIALRGCYCLPPL